MATEEIDLKTLSQGKLEKEIAKASKQKNWKRVRDINAILMTREGNQEKFIAEVEALCTKHGYTTGDLVAMLSKVAKTSSVPNKVCVNGRNWTGRGRAPKEITQGIKDGVTLKDAWIGEGSYENATPGLKELFENKGKKRSGKSKKK